MVAVLLWDSGSHQQTMKKSVHSLPARSSLKPPNGAIQTSKESASGRWEMDEQPPRSYQSGGTPFFDHTISSSNSWMLRVYLPLHFLADFSDMLNIPESSFSVQYAFKNRRARRRCKGFASLPMRHSSLLLRWSAIQIVSQVVGLHPYHPLKRSTLASSLYVFHLMNPAVSSPSFKNNAPLVWMTMVNGVANSLWKWTCWCALLPWFQSLYSECSSSTT